MAGLRNQGSRQRSVSAAPTQSPSPAETPSPSDFGDSTEIDIGELDSLTYLEVDSDHDDGDNEADWDEVAQEEFHNRLLGMIAKIEEDHRDAGDDDWIPSRQASQAKWAIARHKPEGCPTEYIKGPDTASKSKRTQQRYAESNKTQRTLDSFLLQPDIPQPLDADGLSEEYTRHLLQHQLFLVLEQLRFFQILVMMTVHY
ncbi:hypothetical protein B0H13DRAFT_1933806 [Mycena leptocephala]|nr:hypothetical protein B0H13DRAFT_1933806 [Mycena leptocephala]